ncbi:hypothetical protein [Rufibacter tibetensis]|uniref:Uncharacterized protein n=1 Tax=Rufibacter tibetensis TaxID=512763 RepID=A0A0P0C8P1_9BACT|nr:hypothetical protein [Rufibacter tibetensis]ALI97706.1 hypothetical protein DC20_00250 [Rufibacter tibetensis]
MKETQGSFPLFLAVFRKRGLKQVVSWVLLVSFLPLTVSCNYYRLKEEKDISPEKVASLPNYKRFVLHQGQNAWEIKKVAVKDSTVTGNISDVPKDLLPYVFVKQGSSIRYNSKLPGMALNVVHFYVNEFAQQDSLAVIPLSSIKRIDIADKDNGATVASHVFGTIGVAAGVLAIITIIVALTKSSCPFVYVKNDNGYQFVGETYGGAIFSPLERDDYMPLPTMEATGGSVQLKITNELKERQFTNLAQLLVVHHSPKTKVLLDQQGKVHSIRNVVPPQKAFASDGVDYAGVLQEQDSSSWLFNTPDTNLSYVDLQFQKPTEGKIGKLVLRAQNSLWLDYLYGEFTKQFKGIYNAWAEKQKEVPAAELYKWQHEQGLPLLVEVKTAKGWQVVDRIQPIGPLASRDLVVPINLAAVQSDMVQVRLSCGFMFWEIDKAGMDFSVNQPLPVQKVSASTAFEKSGQNIHHLLAASDASYLHQFHVGDEVQLTFPLPAKQDGQVQTLFLHTRGYYEHIREYTGIPNLLTLRNFEKPGHFIEFSRQRYEELAEENGFNHLLTAHANAQ